MNSAQILSTFQSTFPGLYKPLPPSEDEEQKQDEAGAPEAVQNEEHDPYSARIAGINSKFERLRASADEMEQYLRAAAEEAKEAEARALAKADEDFTPAWRNVGLPLKPSHLQLDHGAMAGARLVNPKAIVQEYQAIKGREVLNPPRIAEYADTSAKPNYLKGTHAMEVRQTRSLSPERLARAQAIAGKALTWHTLTADEVAAKMEEAEERRRQLSLKMPRAQFEKEQKIIAAMHHKLTFLRNPRHPLPPAVRTLLDLKPDTKRWAGPRSDPRTGLSPPIKANMTAREDVIFVVEPEEVTFTDYAVGRTYEKLVRVRNVTSVCRGLRVFPPASQYFHVSLPRFPGDAGVLAPGMAAELTLRFCPDSLGDYEDAIGVDTTGRRLTVPLRARRPPPSLTLPEEFDMGQVVIGNIKTEQIAFKNLGGPGRFRIVPEADWPDFAQDAPTDRAVVGPFKIWPLYFEMASEEEIAINVSYEPTEWGSNDERLVLVCDNCQVKTFTLLGNGVSVDVLLHSVDGRMLEPRELDLPLWFGEVAPRSGFAKTVSVRNTTKLPFAFEWSLTRFPQVQHKRRANEPLQTEQQYDEEQDDDGHVLLVDNKAQRGGTGLGTGSGTAGAGTGAGGSPTRQHRQQSGLSLSLSQAALAGTTRSASGAAMAAAAAASPPPRGTQSVSGRPVLLPGAEAAGTPWGVISGSGAHGPDPLALGAVAECVFAVVPERGVLQPGEVMEFQFTFTPPACQCYERWAQLRVDRTPIQNGADGSGMLRGTGSGSGTAGTSHAAIAAAAVCDVLVAEVGLEGLGCLVVLEAVPRLLVLPGTIMPQQRATRRVRLRNPTRGPVDVRVTADDPCISIQPPALTVPSLGTAHVDITLTAPERPGPLRARVVVQPEAGHGPPVPVELRADVGVTHASLCASRLDFGLVRLGGRGQRSLVLRNRSATSATPWSLRELTPAVIEAEKSKLLRAQLLQSSRMLDPVAAAAAIAALQAEQDEEDDGVAAHQHQNGPTGHHRTRQASAGERRAMLTAGRAAAAAEPPPPSPPSPATAPATHVTFEPSSGVLHPGEELAVRVTAHGLVDGRSRSIVQLRSGSGLGHMECIEAFVCVVTPKCVIDRPVIDLGVTFVGVQVRQLLTMRNLSLLPLGFRWSSESADAPDGAAAELRVKPDKGQLAPGEEVELQIRYTPRAVGQSVMYGVCELDGAPQPLGFRVTSAIHGLDVTYDLLTQEEYDEMGAPPMATMPSVAASAPLASVPSAAASLAPLASLASAASVLPPAASLLTVSASGLQPAASALTAAASVLPPAASVLTAAASVPIGLEPSAASADYAASGYFARQQAAAEAALPPPSALFRRGRNGRPELDVSTLQGLPHLPPEVLARIASGAAASTTGDGAAAAGNGRHRRRSSQTNAGGAGGAAAAPTWPPPTPQRHLVADFGKAVPLGETRQMYLVLTNRTAMHTSIRTWLDRFGMEDASRFTKKRVGSNKGGGDGGKGGGGGDDDEGGGGGRRGGAASASDSEGFGLREAGPKIRTSKYTPIKLNSEAEKKSPFRSAKGNEMMSNRRLQEEAEQALGNKGLAVSVLPPETTLAPWSRKVLAISCFNDMCGAYMDMLHVKVGDQPTRDIPVLVGVAGTPLAVQRERVLVRGLRDRAAWRTSLAWGQVPLGVQQSKTFYVFNTGSLDMHLSWQLRRFREYIDLDEFPPTTDVGAGGTGYHDSLWGGGPGLLRDTRAQFKLFEVKLTPEERSGTVRLTATRHADPVPHDDGPFLVEPREALIPGGGSAAFTVSFSYPTARGHAAYLHGACRVSASNDDPDSSRRIELRLWPTSTAGSGSGAADGVGALLSGTFHPFAGAPPTPLQPLRVDLAASSLGSRLEPDGMADLGWSVASIHQPSSHPSFVHTVTLSNTQECPQIFSMNVEGPWDLMAAVPSVPQDPIMYKGTSTLLGPAAATGRLGKNAADGGELFLPPRESVDVTLRYVPGKGDLEALPVRFAAMQARQRVVETTTDYKNHGSLCLAFANGDTQSLPLVAEMLHPRLQVKPRRLNFGKVHLQSPKELRVELSNPTTVDAAWAVTVEGVKPRFPTLPGAGAAASASAQAEAAASGAASPMPRSGRSSANGGAAAGDRSASQSRSSSVASSKSAAAATAAAAAAAEKSATATSATLAAAGQSLLGTGAGERLGTAGVPPPPPKPSAAAPPSGVTGIIAEARIGPYIVRPASGVLPGRGLRLPHTQTISILFAPTEPESYDGELIFAVLRGKECSVEIDGIGSVEETDEHKAKLFVI
ncbi:hypothetical protein PLESTB_000174500 [Pleodorina starrii]|uniref:Uncharacterized protein n=1 Tax=Pleodorina starrii TaxID=330485 RepID=A0A9W6BCB1_9CHLO|nr:hypothetical protein PLESTB_000174500 [Pleodorina starrii]GLC66178.1 hypothetical protein PLESTF_000393400 [Pleodorina starrii]